MTDPLPDAPTHDAGSQDAGLSLLELVIVMALFALVAVLGLQSLTGTLRLRELLATTERQTADTTVALALLRADLGAAAPLLFHDPDGQTASAVDPGTEGTVLSLSLAGQAVLPGVESGGFTRAIWRNDPARGLLTRQLWPVLFPAGDNAAGPEVVMAEGITGLAIRTYSADRGWVRGRDPSIIGATSSLPEGIEVTVTSDRFGPVVLVQAYR